MDAARARASEARARMVADQLRRRDIRDERVLAAMGEVGLDLSQGKPQYLSDDLARTASLLVTMGCGEACPHVPGLERDDWPLEDPKGKPLERVREIRDDVRQRVAALLRTRGWA